MDFACPELHFIISMVFSPLLSVLGVTYSKDNTLYQLLNFTKICLSPA